MVIIILYSCQERARSGNSTAHRESVRGQRQCILEDVAIMSDVVYQAPEDTIVDSESGYCSPESLNMACKKQGTQSIWSRIWKKSSRIWK